MPTLWDSRGAMCMRAMCIRAAGLEATPQMDPCLMWGGARTGEKQREAEHRGRGAEHNERGGNHVLARLVGHLIGNLRTRRIGVMNVRWASGMRARGWA